MNIRLQEIYSAISSATLILALSACGSSAPPNDAPPPSRVDLPARGNSANPSVTPTPESSPSVPESGAKTDSTSDELLQIEGPSCSDAPSDDANVQCVEGIPSEWLDQLDR